VVFPVEVLPVQVALSALLHQAIALALVLVLMAGYGIRPGAALAALPLLALVQLLLMIGLGWTVATLHVYFRDTAQVLAVVLPMWFYLTPIIYPYTLVPQALQPLLAANPLTALVEGYREILLEDTVPLGAGAAWLAVASVLAFCGGAAVFERARGELADLV
jgi:lipopolysaccharide transport system permease protein